MHPSLVSLTGPQDGYGPAMLSVLEYVSRIYGAHIERECLYRETIGEPTSIHEQVWGSQVFQIENYNEEAAAYINGRRMFEAGPNLRIVTDLKGRLLKVMGYTQDTDVKKACRNLKLPVQP